MPWWGYALLGVLAAVSILLLVLWLVAKGKAKQVGLSSTEKDKLLEVEKTKNEQLKQASVNLSRELVNIKLEYKKKKDTIDEERRKEEKELAEDPDRLGSELDQLLDSSVGEDSES